MFTNKVYQSFNFPVTFVQLLVFHKNHSYQHPSFLYLHFPRLVLTESQIYQGNKNYKEILSILILFIINNKHHHFNFNWLLLSVTFFIFNLLCIFFLKPVPGRRWIEVQQVTNITICWQQSTGHLCDSLEN